MLGAGLLLRRLDEVFFDEMPAVTALGGEHANMWHMLINIVMSGLKADAKNTLKRIKKLERKVDDAQAGKFDTAERNCLLMLRRQCFLLGRPPSRGWAPSFAR